MKAFRSVQTAGLLFLAFGLVHAAWAQTNVSGNISVDTVWSDPVYHVTSTVYVDAGVTLTIEPGTVVKFEYRTFLNVRGNLQAQGTAQDPIYFTDIRDDTVGGDSNGDGSATVPGVPWWQSIWLNDGANAVLDHIEVRYAGRYHQYNEPGAIYKTGAGTLTLTRSTIRDSDRRAVVLKNTNAAHLIEDNRIEGTAQYQAIFLRDASGNSTIADNLIVGANSFGIHLRDDSFATVTGNVIRDSGHSGIYLGYNGVTGDVTIEGNTVNNSSNHGIYIQNASGSVTVAGNTIRGNGNSGMYLTGASTAPDIFGNDIHNNGNTGIYAAAAANPLIGGSVANANLIHGNGTYGVENASSGVTIIASCNWWGDASGPGGQGLGTGDAISAGVDAVPWNLEAGGQCYGGLPTRFVAVTGSDDGGANTCLDQQAPCATIAHAIGQADVGGTVQVAAGTYPEQVVINKTLRLAGQPGAVIQAPASPAAFEIPEAPAGTSFEPVVIAFGGTESGGRISGSDTIEVDISGFTIDGQDRISASGSVRTAGILLRNAYGGLNGNTVVNMFQSLDPDPSRQTTGILVYGDSIVDVIGNDVSGYSRAGIVIQGDGGPLPDPAGNVEGNTVTGPGQGMNPNWGPNGIQISYGASGSVVNNTISGHYHPSTFAPGGVVVVASDHVIVDGNDLSSNEASIQVQAASGTQITNNTVTTSDYGMLIYPGSSDTLIDGNDLDGNGYGVVLYGTAGDPTANATITNNTINGSTGAAVGIVGDSTAVPSVDISGNQFGDNFAQLDADPGVLTEEAFAAANTFNLNISLSITPGVPGTVTTGSGWDHFTANLTSDGATPENVVLWIKVAGIADPDVSSGMALELWDSGSASWQRFGWGGTSHWAIGRDAWFLGRGGSQVVGFPVSGGHDEDMYLRLNWPNGTYSATTSLESVDSGDGSGNPGDRIYFTQTDPIVVESTPSDLALTLTAGLPGGSTAPIQDGWAHFSSTLSNSGGDVPENVVLWIEVAGIGDTGVAGGLALELWDSGQSQWRRYGWGGASHWNINRDAWFMGRDGQNIVGFPIPAGFSDTQALRVNWPDGSYSATISVESLDSADGSGAPGDRIYLNQTESLNVEQFASASLAIAPASHDFGEVVRLETATTSFTVSNTGSSTSSLELTGVSVSGDSQFAITGSGNCASGNVLSGGDTCTVEVSFAPGAVGTFTGSLDITSDAGAGSAALSGNGVLPDWADSFDGAFDEPDWQFFAFDGTPGLYTPATAQITSGYLQINDPTALYAGAYIPRSFGEARVAALINADGTNTGTGPDNQIDQGVLSHFNPSTQESYTAYMRMEANYQDLVLAKVDASNFDPALIDERVRVAESSDGDWSMDRMYVVELDVVDQGGGQTLLIARAFDADTGALLATVEATDTAPFGPGYGGLVAITNSTGVNGTFDTASAVSSFASASVSDDLVDFGWVVAGTTSDSATVTISNDGNAPLTINNLSLAGANAAEFAIANDGCTGTVSAGASCTFDISFTPSGLGSHSAEVQIDSDASTSIDVVLLEGEGVALDWADSFDGAFDEPDWQFFAFDGTPALYTPATAQITSGYLQINDPTALYAGAYIPRSFGEARVAALVNADGTNTGTSPDNQIDQGVLSHFNPSTQESYTAYMRMEANYQDLVLAKVDASNFDPALIDERVRVAESSDGDWSMDRMYVVELDVVDQGGGQTLLIARAFDADTGALLATVEATDTAPFGPGYGGLVAITNSTGVNGTFDTASAVSSFASASVSNDLVDFGQVEAHSTSAPTTVTISNSGNAELTISDLSLAGADATEFAIANDNCAGSVTAGASCTFDVSFTPDGVGARSAEVRIESSASTSTDLVLLEGEGIPAQATVTLSDLVQTYDGNPRSATVTTSPAGLNVVVTYDGGSVLPVVVGTYAVEATVDEPDYVGSASGTLTIDKADQTISFPAIADKPADSGPFTISASSDSGLLVSFSVASGPATVSGNQITLTGATPGDTVTISADQAGNANWNAAPTVSQSFDILVGQADRIEAASATSISGQAGQPVAAGDLPAVRVLDSNDNPVPGVTVSFAITSGGGTLTGATQSTDASGEARLGAWTLGNGATQTLEAAAPGLTGSPVLFTANVPLLEISPESHDYGNVGLLDDATASFTVTNTGSSSLELTGISISGDSQFTLTGSGSCASGNTLNGGDNCTVEVNFDPDAIMSFSGALDITSDAGNVSATLSGAGIQPDWADSFDGAFDEPDWQFFAFDGTPALYTPATAQITSGYLQINDPTALYAGAYIPRSFGEARVAALVNADGTNTGTSPDNQIDQGVLSHFNPSTQESYTAYMRMEANYQDLVLAKVDASNFDPALIDERVRVAESSDGDWSMDRMYVVELDVVDQGGGQALLIARAFDADTGALLATVEATDTAAFGPGYGGLVAITNSTGVNGTFDTASAVSSFASASVSNDLVDFGQVEAHSTSAPTTVTISNSGNAELTISDLSLAGADAAEFAIANDNCAGTVSAGTSCTFDVSFTPDGVGARSAEVRIESNASTSTDLVLLEGEGIPAQATVTLSDLVQTYDGSPKSASVTTSPAGLNVVVTYDGATAAPVNAGSYTVEASVDEPDYSGSTTGTLEIEAADQTIDFPAIADRTVDDSPFTVSATASSGLPVSFSVVSGPATVSGNQVTLDGTPGQVIIAADQAGDGNWNAAPTVQHSFQVTEGSAASIEAASATTINGQAGQPVAAGDLPTVRVADSQDNPVAGVTVSFAVTSGGGSVTGAAQVTNASGIAQVGSWTLGGEATQTLEASAPGLSGNPVVFTANADADYQFAISVDDNRQSIEVGERNSYVIVVSNAGSSDAIGAQVTAQLPPELDAGTADWTCFAGGAASCGGPDTGHLADAANLPSGASVVYVLEADVIGGSGGSIELEAQVALGGATANDSDSTDVLITEDAIFSDRFEVATAGSRIELDTARQQLGAWIEASGGVTGGLPPSALLRGVDGHGDDAFRVRVLATDLGPLLRLSLRDAEGHWQRSRWYRVSSQERLLAVDYDAAQGSLLLAGKQIEAALVTGRAAASVVELITDPAVSIDSID